jgi:hypothetical protein
MGVFYLPAVVRVISHSSSAAALNRIAPPGSLIAGRSPRRVQRSTVSVDTPSRPRPRGP